MVERIVEAARVVLVRDGYEAFTGGEPVADEAPAKSSLDDLFAL